VVVEWEVKAYTQADVAVVASLTTDPAKLPAVVNAAKSSLEQALSTSLGAVAISGPNISPVTVGAVVAPSPAPAAEPVPVVSRSPVLMFVLIGVGVLAVAGVGFRYHSVKQSNAVTDIKKDAVKLKVKAIEWDEGMEKNTVIPAASVMPLDQSDAQSEVEGMEGRERVSLMAGATDTTSGMDMEEVLPGSPTSSGPAEEEEVVTPCGRKKKKDKAKRGSKRSSKRSTKESKEAMDDMELWEGDTPKKHVKKDHTAKKHVHKEGTKHSKASKHKESTKHVHKEGTKHHKKKK
jgi:hypothetical protein